MSRRINVSSGFDFRTLGGSRENGGAHTLEIETPDPDSLEVERSASRYAENADNPEFPHRNPLGRDSYIDRLIKYIPSEIIALYLGATNVVPYNDAAYYPALWIITSLTTLCTPLYMYLATRESGKPNLYSQIAIASVAFPVWVFAIGGPFRSFPWYEGKHWIGAIAITFMTFLSGLYVPRPKQS